MIEIYTDGGCRGNPGIGAWAAYIVVDQKINYLIGKGLIETTNNQMELTAAIESLEFIERLNIDLQQPILMHLDSKYAIDCVTKWIHSWELNNWKTSNKQPVKNKELIIRFYNLIKDKNIKLEWVKGHAGVIGNEICDQAANEIMDAITKGDISYKIKRVL